MKNKYRHKIFSCFKAVIFWGGVLSLSSCAPYIYTAKPQCTPLFDKKNEKLISAETGTTSANFQGAYAVINHAFITGNTSFSLPNNSSNPNFFRIGEFSAGYFGPADSSDNIARFELQAGYGFGYRSGFGSVPSSWFLFIPLGINNYTLNTHYVYRFVQPALGWVYKKSELGFSCRITYIEFPGFSYEMKSYSRSGVAVYQVTSQWGPEYFFQPSVFATVGHSFKGIFQLGFSRPLQGPDEIYNHPAYLDFYFTFGFQGMLFND